MKIFYSGLKYHNYNPKNGLTFEHNNFCLSLASLRGVEITYFPFDRILEVGKEEFNKEILEATKEQKPDLFFFFMLTDELDRIVLEELKEYTTTLAWFADDSWRFYNYSKFWAKHFTWVATTYSWMPELYRKLGQKNVIRSQWAANTNVYKPVELNSLEERIDVSFVGGWSRPREKLISSLTNKGIGVKTFGSGWEDGRVSDDQMLKLFSASNINLGLNPPPGYFNKNSLGRLFFKKSINRVVPSFCLLDNFNSWFHRGVPQIKARHFEIPACGGMLFTSMADDLDKYYRPGEEIVIYKDVNDLADKVKYYLSHKGEIEKIAKAGYERTVRDHSYEKRFGDIFKIIFHN